MEGRSTNEDFSPTDSFLSREDTLSQLGDTKRWDVIVVGGGIHGACFAHLSALNGLRTVLLERADYASGTSSRSSKMAHGGLRYLEMFDFQQVFEGIKAREALFHTASHLVYPYEFLALIEKGEWWKRTKLGIGLRLYDLFVRSAERRHRWISRATISDSDWGHELMQDHPDLQGGFIFHDGIMDDARIVLEHVLAARELGATCLNYVDVRSFRSESSGVVSVDVCDLVSQQSHELTGSVLVNCAGPWVPDLRKQAVDSSSVGVRYSRGVHLLFDREWQGPARFLSMREPGRYYFVWPHFAGTLVGTTELEVEHAEPDPMPFAEEVERILFRLRRDLPSSSLSLDNLHYGYAGVRTLPTRGGNQKLGRISRKHIWDESEGMLTLYGGKFTTATWTVVEGMKIVFSILNRSTHLRNLSDLLLPGARSNSLPIENFRREADRNGIPSLLVERIIGYLGGRVGLFECVPDSWEVLPGGILRGELEIALRIEQAVTLEDLMRRRLRIEYLPGHGLEALPGILEVLKKHFPKVNFEQESLNYRERMEKLHRNLGTS